MLDQFDKGLTYNSNGSLMMNKVITISLTVYYSSLFNGKGDWLLVCLLSL